MTQAPPSGGGAGRKILLILGIIFGVILLVCCGGLTTCYFVGRSAATKLDAQMRAEMARIEAEQKAAEARANAENNRTEPQDPGENAAETPKKAPVAAKGWPSDIPKYPGMTSTGEYNQAGVSTIVGTTTDTSAKVLAFYKSKMEGAGWTETTTMNMGATSVAVYSKDDRTFNVTATTERGTTNFSLVHSVEK